MNRRIIPVSPTQARVIDTRPTQPRVDPAEVARALGAEPVGVPAGFAGMTFAALRERAAALIARRGPGGPGQHPFDVSPHLRAWLDRMSVELRADGLVITPAELANALLEISAEAVGADRAGVVAKLRERADRAGGQPT